MLKFGWLNNAFFGIAYLLDIVYLYNEGSMRAFAREMGMVVFGLGLAFCKCWIG